LTKKEKRISWAGKAIIAFLVLISYLIFYFAGVFGNPVVMANPDTYYFFNNADYAVSGSKNMRTSMPPGTNNNFSGCRNQSTTNSGKYCHITPGTKNSFFEAAYSGPKKKGWMTDNNSLLTGDIASGTWTVYIKYDFYDSGNCSYSTNYIQYKVWKADADLNNATVIKDWTYLCDISAGTNITCNASFTPGAISLSSQVLHIEFRQYIVYGKSGCLDTPDDSLNFYCDQGSAERLDIPTFSPVPENSFYFLGFVPFVPIVIDRFISFHRSNLDKKRKKN